jgi:hypothetical protein
MNDERPQSRDHIASRAGRAQPFRMPVNGSRTHCSSSSSRNDRRFSDNERGKSNSHGTAAAPAAAAAARSKQPRRVTGVESWSKQQSQNMSSPIFAFSQAGTSVARNIGASVTAAAAVSRTG